VTTQDFPLPTDLPEPVDDGACDHLIGMAMPHVALRTTGELTLDISALGSGRTVIYCYPMTGVPGAPLPEGWDLIPGARGCTPQACGFRDHHAELATLGAGVFGLSTQSTAYQQEMAARLQLPFEVLSDAQHELTDALRLPTFEADGMRLVKRVTLIVRDGTIEACFYPVFPSDQNAQVVIDWLRANPE
jgi:peroxiredoxin